MKPEVKTAHASITVFLSYLDSMVAACCLQSSITVILQWFDAVGWATGSDILPVKVLPQQFPRISFWTSA